MRKVVQSIELWLYEQSANRVRGATEQSIIDLAMVEYKSWCARVKFEPTHVASFDHTVSHSEVSSLIPSLSGSYFIASSRGLIIMFLDDEDDAYMLSMLEI